MFKFILIVAIVIGLLVYFNVGYDQFQHALLSMVACCDFLHEKYLVAADQIVVWWNRYGSSHG